MNVQQTLTKELINYIFNNLGMVSDPLWGKAGITENLFKTEKNISIQFDDEICEFPVYAAECSVGEDKINILAIKISDLNYTEFCMVFRMNNLSVYGLKKTIEQDDFGTFLISTKDGSWIDTSIYERLVFCAGLEKLTDNGIGWKPFEDIDLLFKYLLEIVGN